MLQFFKVERNAALLLLISAIAGLVVANSPLAQGFTVLREITIGLESLHLNLSVVNWLGEFFIAGFFLLIGLELKREFKVGAFKNRSALAIPGLAALLGAVVPALIFIILVSGSAAAGWPIPMATDVTFALAVYSIFGAAFPKSARVFLLSFAVIDDVIAIVVIALFLGSGLDLVWALPAAASLALFAWAAKKNAWIAVVLGLLAWYFTYRLGVQPAVTGVILGLLVPMNRVETLEHRIHPWVTVLVLPVFAFFASGVSISGGLMLGSALTIAILLRPVGKVIGINLGVVLGKILVRGDAFTDLKPSDYVRVSLLGGIGFTVALLIGSSVYAKDAAAFTESTIATLAALAISAVLGAVALATRKRAN
jgi:NhaA family Na+:H+ antiporter